MTTPIVDFVKKYADSHVLRLHMPGHKGKSVLGCESLDITEISGADVLYSASGVIKLSQQNATELFGTKKTLYSTEGASLTIRAMLKLVEMYAKKEGRRPFIAAGRNAHKVFLTTAALLDFDVDWLYGENSGNLLCTKITADYLNEYLNKASEKPVAVYITSPDYLGNITEIASLSAVCKQNSVLLLVDNAHGAYLKFLPNDIHPITLGADICCDSAHKTLPALTGGAYLHISKGAPEFFEKTAETAMSLFASTSPSYLILQSLDMVNDYLANGYKQKLAAFEIDLRELKKRLSDLGYSVLGDEVLKLTLSPKSYGYTGIELADILRGKNIECEFADPDYLVLMLTPEITSEEIDYLFKALASVKRKQAITACPPALNVANKKMSIKEAMFSPSKSLAVDKCEGKILASPSVTCPPAVPIVISGEEIDKEKINCFKYYGIDTCFVVDDEINARQSLANE